MINVQNTPSPAAALPSCPVSPLDRVTFTPYEISELAPAISGTVFQALDTNLGNWRVRIVREGESFPHGLSANVYSDHGTFKVHSALNPDVQPAIA
ncbi:hypothetical protein QO021_28925 (plasmid) [Pseudomonas amygdali pv. lachrymans]|uniref:hypothetical protein n=1 Tax=Pseudomonas amygdali TaxID=47877 RepID=UPI000AF0E7CD|nr:hypothetical protein [Pseudomonas amygdali]RMM39260.1 hypothetical protein ALQ79_200464 [Pseudomonas amygdali pv. lachrymans]WIO61583.1 hypothetical protein QO021_28925 [Pseudomonas amygdali pv. lachrymans]